MINNTDAVRIIDTKRGDAVIIPTMNAGNVRFGLPTVTTNQNLDLPISGAMGKASNVGLGVALAQPGRQGVRARWRRQPADEPGHSGNDFHQAAQELLPLPLQ